MGKIKFPSVCCGRLGHIPTPPGDSGILQEPQHVSLCLLQQEALSSPSGGTLPA